jgi:hypothetical protein
MTLSIARTAWTTEVSLVLKGHDFSRAVKRTRQAAALAAEGMRTDSRAFSQGLKPRISFARLAARLKSFPFKAAAFASAILIGLLALPCAAQSAASTPPARQTASPATQPSKGQVIFSRSTDENSQTATQTLPSAAQTASPQPAQAEAGSSADNAERQAVRFTSFNLDVHLDPAAQRIAVRALIAIRNGGSVPLARIPLQISSSLNWEEIRGNGRNLAFQVATLNSDVDHTGQLHEAVIPLVQPLAPGAALRLDVTYSGTIQASAQRLLAVGAPEKAALHSDWDQIAVPFTGLRGLGNVVWYPASSVPVLLGDGARLFDEMGREKLQLSGAHFRLRLSDEFPHGQAPTVALINGHSVPLTVTEPNGLDQGQEVDGVATASLVSTTLGFEAPSLFVAIRTPHSGPNLTAWTLPDDNVAVEFWNIAAEAVTPFLEGWLGQKPRSPLTLLDLPDPEDAPFETGALLAAPLCEPGSTARPGGLENALAHALAQAWITPADAQQGPLASRPNDGDLSPERPAWLDEGVATFMTTLWVEKRQGRAAALGMLEADRSALALAEPASPGESAGQPLAKAISPVYYRTKAAYVLWMLRDLAGDPALGSALRADDAVGGTPAAPRPFEQLRRATSEHPDLSWFFADWVDADKGLPDLSIVGVYPNAVDAGNWLVAVDLANSGYAAAEIPLTVRSMTASGPTSVTRRVLVPARGRITERILIQGKPTSVQANDGTVPETEASVHVMNLNEPDSSSQTTPQ